MSDGPMGGRVLVESKSRFCLLVMSSSVTVHLGLEKNSFIHFCLHAALCMLMSWVSCASC